MKILSFTGFELPFYGYEIEYVYEENSFYDKVLNKKYDVILISFDFFSYFLEIKRYVKSIVIFLSDYCDEFIFKKVLEVGDYCYLKTQMDLLDIRLSYLRKKVLKTNVNVFKYKNFLYNFITKELYKNSVPLKLSAAEKDLLEALIKNRNRYLSKEDILEECDKIDSESSIKVLISRLRKLGFDIINQKNLGYKLKVD